MPPKLRGTVTLLGVFDIRRSLDFYQGILGFETVQKSEPTDAPNWIWMKRDDVEIMLNTLYEIDHRPATEDAARAQAHRDTILFMGCRDLDEAYAYFQSKGVALDPPVTREYGMKQLWLRDPDGYLICLQWTAADSR